MRAQNGAPGSQNEPLNARSACFGSAQAGSPTAQVQRRKWKMLMSRFRRRTACFHWKGPCCVDFKKSRCTHYLVTLSATDHCLAMIVAKGMCPTNVITKYRSKYSEIMSDPFTEVPAEVCQVLHSASTSMGIQLGGGSLSVV
jgi:hypothetical protein